MMLVQTMLTKSVFNDFQAYKSRINQSSTVFPSVKFDVTVLGGSITPINFAIFPHQSTVSKSPVPGGSTGMHGKVAKERRCGFYVMKRLASLAIFHPDHQIAVSVSLSTVALITGAIVGASV